MALRNLHTILGIIIHQHSPLDKHNYSYAMIMYYNNNSLLKYTQQKMGIFMIRNGETPWLFHEKNIVSTSICQANTF